MRPDQIQRLQELSEKLADRFLLEADPDEWPGDCVAPSDMTSQQRGDAYWCKKNAMATGGVLRYTLDLAAKHTQPGGASDPESESDIDRSIKEAERRAAEAVARVVNKAKKRKFDERVHGKSA